MTQKQGFTLIEILIVVIIIGVLAGLALPRYERAVENARVAEALKILSTIRSAEFQFASAHNRYTNNTADLNIQQVTGTYFNFNASALGTPFDGVDNQLAVAIRNPNRSSSLFPPGYNISIFESGNFNSTDQDVRIMLQ